MGKHNLSTKIIPTNIDYQAFLHDRVNKYLEEYVASNNKIEEAIVYALTAPGKRVRPTLLYLVSDALSLDLIKIDSIAAAVEIIHTYSLVHDDLPCMDDDEIRRGQPSLHIKYDEAAAVLAGDAMQSMAIEMIINNNFVDGQKNIELVKNFLSTIGSKGMILGQALDIEYESREADEKEILMMCELKTGLLIEYCFHAPLMIANEKNEHWKRLAKIVGISFQLIDDLLDLKQSSEILGKKTQKDKLKNKKNYPQMFGEEKTLSLLKKYKSESNLILAEMNLEEHILCDYINNLFKRKV